jgi:CrcB protein
VVGETFPWGIVVINALGCFLFGVLWILAERSLVHDEARLVGLTGFLGAYTTFSTFAFDSAIRINQGRLDLAIGNIVLQNTLGLFAVFAGFAFGRWMSGALLG